MVYYSTDSYFYRVLITRRTLRFYKQERADAENVICSTNTTGKSSFPNEEVLLYAAYFF
jgi:hypothetical protein